MWVLEPWRCPRALLLGIYCTEQWGPHLAILCRHQGWGDHGGYREISLAFWESCFLPSVSGNLAESQNLFYLKIRKMQSWRVWVKAFLPRWSDASPARQGTTVSRSWSGLGEGLVVGGRKSFWLCGFGRRPGSDPGVLKVTMFERSGKCLFSSMPVWVT